MRRFAPVLIALLVPALAEAEESKLVAVVPLRAAGDIPAVDKKTLDDVIRSDTATELTPAGYLVLTEDVMLRVLADNGVNLEEANEASSALGVAKALKARLFISGTVTKVSDGSIVCLVRFFDGGSGAMLAGFKAEGADLRAIRQQFDAQAPQFFQRGLLQLSSGIRFSSNVNVTVPTVTVSSRGGMSQMNIEAEKQLDRCQQIDKDRKAKPEQKAEAWCALSDITDRNPYQEQAGLACRAWREFVTNLHTAETSMTEDYHKLREYLALDRTPEQKLAAVDAFLSTYQSLPAGYPMVDAVRDVHGPLEHGHRVSLPDYHSSTDADGDGVPDAEDRCPFEPGPVEEHGCPVYLASHVVVRAGVSGLTGVTGIGVEGEWRQLGLAVGTGTYALSGGLVLRLPVAFHGFPYISAYGVWSHSYLLHNYPPGGAVGGSVGWDWRFVPWLSVLTGIGAVYDSARNWDTSAHVPLFFDLAIGPVF